MGGHTTPLPRIPRAQSWHPTAPRVALGAGAGAGAVPGFPRGAAAGASAPAHPLPALRPPGRLPQGRLPQGQLPLDLLPGAAVAEEAAVVDVGAVLAHPRLGRALSSRAVPRANTHSRLDMQLHLACVRS